MVFGQDLAQFMMGIPSTGSLDLNTQTTLQAKYLGLFLNDDWRVRNNLINLGIRFDHDFPETERYNRSVSGFDPTAANPHLGGRSRGLCGAPAATMAGHQLQGDRRTDLPLGE